MKKLISLIKACMSSDMNLFKISSKKKGKSSTIIPVVIALYLMFMLWSNANIVFEKLSPMNMQSVLLSISVLSISFLTIIEGIYKSGTLMFNCKDDDLLLSLPIKRKTVLFIRILKFYIFELLFNSLFLLPIIIAYIRWGNVDYTYYITSIIMLLFLPIIPIVISCILGLITSAISSRFKYKNVVEIVISFILLSGVMFISFSSNKAYDYLVTNASGINESISKIYYPAGLYSKLALNFNITDLLIFIGINIGIFILSIYLLSIFYFKINTRMKKVITNKKINVGNLVIKSRSKTTSLIRKELNTFFKTPVFIINSGFALVLFIIAVILVVIKYDSFISIFSNEVLFFNKDFINNNLSIIIFLLITITSYMTSITNSVISLEGRNINILKSLPVSVKKILMSKIYSCMVITTPVLLIGDIVLFIRFKTSIIESILLLLLSILIPLVSHFIGILINLKYPKLDAESSSEVVKQSTSSFIAVMIGMILLIISVVITMNVIGIINSTILLLIFTIIYILIDLLLYHILSTSGVKKFNELS